MDIVIKDQADYSKLFYQILHESDTKKVNIYLYLIFLHPMDVVILVEFIIYSLLRGIEVSLIVNNSNVRNYLSAIGLFEFCSQNYEEPSEIIEIPSFTAMPLRRVNRETMVYYIQRTQDYFQVLCPGKDLGMLNITISEMVNNVYDHSRSPIDSYVFSQFYPNLNKIKIAVSDLGYGIPRTVNKFFQEKGLKPLEQVEAVQWALKLNSTTKSMPYNAGRGLDTINSFVGANRGEWRLFSDQIQMISQNGEARFFQNPIEDFIGTVIEISIDINNLENLENQDFLDWEF
jgi:anti-sigma regulatory factor (Ser/Thr protein kinase)